MFMNLILKDTEKMKKKSIQKVNVTVKVNKKKLIETLLQAIGVSITANNEQTIVKESMIDETS